MKRRKEEDKDHIICAITLVTNKRNLNPPSNRNGIAYLSSLPTINFYKPNNP